MPPNHTTAGRVSLPWPALAHPEPRDPETAQSGLNLLPDWRRGSAATAVVMAALLPFAVACHVTSLVMIAASVIGAVPLAAGCHLGPRGTAQCAGDFP